MRRISTPLFLLMLPLFPLSGCQSLTFSQSDPARNVYDDITDPYELGSHVTIPIKLRQERPDTLNTALKVGAGVQLDSETYLLDYAAPEAMTSLLDKLSHVGFFSLEFEF